MTVRCRSRAYATYVKDRLSGFGGTGNTFAYQDLVDFPNLAKRVFGDPGRSRRKTSACNGPIAFCDTEAVRTDIENLASAIGTTKGRHAFISAASPGVLSLFFRNDYYSSEDAYLDLATIAWDSDLRMTPACGVLRLLRAVKISCPPEQRNRSVRLTWSAFQLIQHQRCSG
jgi:5-methyltetrahydropteroyltriglutamate--homocysteine methyltransferase